ncbi:MAG: glycine cleavage system protein T [Anaerolineae bacterium]|nr:glycine cleavage system protein T [Anaerolineae bacterium]
MITLDPPILVDRSNLGLLKFTGKSRLDLIHRMSTQAVNSLSSGQGAATVLTTDIARIIDRIILYSSSEAVYCLTGESNGDFIARYLLRFVFFNDDFHIQDLSQETAIWGVYGTKAGERLAAAGFPEVDLPLHHWREVKLEGLTAYLHRTDPVGGDGYFVMSQQGDKEAVGQRLTAAGCTPADETTFDYWRIASGQPRLGRELTQEYIPLEADLWADVSFKKGCYIGQEIIARMESRGKLAKRLYRLRPDAWVEPGTELLTAKGKKGGQISSAAAGPAGVVALGYIRTAVLGESEPDITLYAGDVPVHLG